MKNELIKKLELLSEVGDVDFYEDDNEINITFNDFDGFDDNWSEIDRVYENPSLVQEVLCFLEDNCTSKGGDFYYEYEFEDFTVEVGYASYDI